MIKAVNQEIPQILVKIINKAKSPDLRGIDDDKVASCKWQWSHDFWHVRK